MVLQDSQSSGEVIVLNELENGLPGLSKKMGGALAEVSAFCLESQRHLSGVRLIVKGDETLSFEIHWENIMTEDILNSWNDLEEATEYGASGLAIILILKLTPYTVIRRARKGDRVDYWLDYKESKRPFQDAARLEISGILTADTHNNIKTRTVDKRTQVKRSSNRTPVYIAIIEFSQPESFIENVSL